MRVLLYLLTVIILFWLSTKLVLSSDINRFKGSITLVEGKIVNVSCLSRKSRAYYKFYLQEEIVVDALVPNQRCDYSISEHSKGSFVRAYFNRRSLMELRVDERLVYDFAHFSYSTNIVIFLIAT